MRRIKISETQADHRITVRKPDLELVHNLVDLDASVDTRVKLKISKRWTLLESQNKTVEHKNPCETIRNCNGPQKP